MTRKRKGRPKGKAGEQKKGAQKRDGSTSSFRTHSPKPTNQPKGKNTSHPSRSRSRDHGRHSTEAATESEPLNKAVQTLTSSCSLQNKETQTDTVSHATQETQTEISGNTETTEVSQPTDLSPEDVRVEGETVLPRNKGNESDGEKDTSVERKKRRISESREPTNETKEKTELSDGCREQEGDDKKDKDTNEKHLEGDSKKDTNVKSGTKESKSYAAATAAGKTKESKEEEKSKVDKVDSKRKPCPVRAPAQQPVFTFYMYAVLDKRFTFDRQHDSLWLLTENETFELQITHVLDLQQNGYLIETTLPIWGGFTWAVPIKYKYAVQKRRGRIEEIALRYVTIPTDNTVKELHLYEGYISSSSKSFKETMRYWLLQNQQEEICKYWETSAHALLDRVFQKWESFKNGEDKTLIEHLNSYKEGFQSVGRRLQFPQDFFPPQIHVGELISERLSLILKGKSGGKTSESVISLEVALSVFKVCCGCRVNLGPKDWGKLCHVVSERTASLEERQTTLTAIPSIEFTVMGLMNLCAMNLISEVVLLVPVLHLLRKQREKSDPGTAMDEQRWAGLDKFEYPLFRERIRGNPNKRRFVRIPFDKHF